MKPTFISWFECLMLLSVPFLGIAQTDTLPLTNKDALYDRPFVHAAQLGAFSTSLGGYLEANSNYFSEDGVSEGLSLEMRRFNIFLFATLRERIRFISELEFEHGTNEIELETALLDFELHPGLVFRAGVVLVPLGYFNQNHDSPKWEFVERPLVSTNIIPSTYSDLGFGIHGKLPLNDWTWSYELYLLNGLQEGVVANEEGRTFLGAGKSERRFEEDNNGSLALSGRMAFTRRGFGEVGLSTYWGWYNTYRADGLTLDSRRALWVGALDYSLQLGKLRFLGEAAYVRLDVPEGVQPFSGEAQWGTHLDLKYPLWQGKLFNWEGVALWAVLRGEAVDYNLGRFEEINAKKRDEVLALVPGLSLRFSEQTLLRFNYRLERHTDLFGNPPVKRAGFQFGLASYF